jgi:hypothetical protein
VEGRLVSRTLMVVKDLLTNELYYTVVQVVLISAYIVQHAMASFDTIAGTLRSIGNDLNLKKALFDSRIRPIARSYYAFLWWSWGPGILKYNLHRIALVRQAFGMLDYIQEICIATWTSLTELE